MGAGETVSATVAALLGKDPTLAALSARNALENNMAQAMTVIAVWGTRLLQVARLDWRAKSTMDAAEDMGTGVETFPGGDEVGETGQREGYESAPQDRTGADVEGYAPAVPSSTQEGFGIADDAPDMRILTSQEDYADRLNALMASEDLSRIETTVLLNGLKAVGAVLGDSPAARIIAPQVMQDGKAGASLGGLTGEYRSVKGHYVHTKKAFDGHVNYDPKKGFSISEEYMKSINVKHQDVTNAQRRLFTELSKSGRANTLTEHSRIAVEALVEGGASRELSRKIVAESLNSLRRMDVRNPVNIPWNK